MTKYASQQLLDFKPVPSIEELYHYSERIDTLQVITELQQSDDAQRTHLCGVCSDGFTTPNNLASHLLQKHGINTSKPKQKKCTRCRTTETCMWRRKFDRNGQPRGSLCNACYQLARYHATKKVKAEQKAKVEPAEQQCTCLTCRQLRTP